jgi:membrane protein required for colicin V production
MILDLIAVLVILGSMFLGAWKGLAWQVAGLLSLLAGFVIALPFSAPVAPLFGATAPLNRFIAVAVLYVVVSLAIYVAAFWYREVIQKWQLDNWDRHLGGVLGAFKGVLFCLVLSFFALTLIPKLQDPILSTKTGKVMAYTIHELHPVWPPGVHAIIHPYIEHFEEPDETPAPSAPQGPPPAPPPPKPQSASLGNSL